MPRVSRSRVFQMLQVVRIITTFIYAFNIVVICVHISCYLCCSVYCLCVNVYCHRVITQLQLINISYIIKLTAALKTLVVICVVRLLFVLFDCYLCCSVYCLCVNVYFHRVITQLQLINISYIIKLTAALKTLVVICIVRLLYVLFYALFVCKCVLPPGDNPIAVNKYIIKSTADLKTLSAGEAVTGWTQSLSENKVCFKLYRCIYVMRFMQ
jgi:hypothetical protein